MYALGMHSGYLVACEAECGIIIGYKGRFYKPTLLVLMKFLHMIAFCLLIVGGLNWLLVAFNYNLVEMIFGSGSTLSMLIYVLVGLSAIYEVVMHKKQCKVCASGGMV